MCVAPTAVCSIDERLSLLDLLQFDCLGVGMHHRHAAIVATIDFGIGNRIALGVLRGTLAVAR